jgi:hypothetical protein
LIHAPPSAGLPVLRDAPARRSMRI